MNRNQKISAASFAASLLMLASGAHAEAGDIYVSGALGASHYNLDCAGLSKCDKNTATAKVVGGYMLTPNVAAELGYYNFGKVKLKDGVGTSEIQTSGPAVGLAYHLDLSPQWGLVARGGIGYFGTNFNDVRMEGTRPVITDLTDRRASAYGGLGVGYKLSKNVSLDASWEVSQAKFKTPGSRETDRSTINAFSLGATYRF